MPLKALLIGGAIGVAAFFALLVIFAAILPNLGAKTAWLPYIAIFAGGVSAFVSGYLAAKGAGAKGMLVGIGCAGLELLIIGAVVFIAAKGFALATVFFAATMLCCGGAGGVFGVHGRTQD